MKTLFLKTFMLGLLVCFLSINAQKRSKFKKNTGHEWKFGVTAGAVYSLQNGFQNIDTKPNIGITAGGFTNFSFSDNLKLQISALYSEYGTEFSVNDFSKIKSKDTYISIPLVIKNYFGEHFYINLGPQANFLISSKIGDENDDSTNSFDIGATGGLGFTFTENLGIDLNYYYGLSNIKDSEKKYNYSAISAKLFFEF